MSAAELGDDTYREDPTVIRLEERVADLLAMASSMLTIPDRGGRQLLETGVDQAPFVGRWAHICCGRPAPDEAVSGATVDVWPRGWASTST